MTPQLALLGCAHIHTQGFIKTLLKRTDVKVKSVWDHDAARGQARADELSARFLGDYHTILSDPEITGVIVCSETDRHQELVLATCEAKKKFIFVEKPLGMGAKDAIRDGRGDRPRRHNVSDRLLHAGRDVQLHPRAHRQGHVRQNHPHPRQQLPQRRGLGGWFDEKPADRINEWRRMANPKIAGCGAFGDLGTHSLDILLWMMGDVSEVTATLDNGTARYEGCDETGEAMMRFKNGTIGTLAAGWDDVANPVFFLLSGTEGHAAIINDQLFITSKKLEGADGKTPWTNLPVKRLPGSRHSSTPSPANPPR